MNPKKSIVYLVLMILAASHARGTAATPTVEQWDAFEVALPGPTDGNPFTDVKLSAEFSQGSTEITVPGFYDGEGVYRVRFAPPSQGPWTYITRSNSPPLNGQKGDLIAAAPTGSNHGPVHVLDTFHFAYADGKHYFQVGTTCYAWTHQPDDLEEKTLDTLSKSPFNKLRMCIFPKSYTYNTNDPVNYPFVRGADGKFDFTRFDPGNWQHFERRVADLRRLGIEADIILFHPYDRWGFAEMDKESDDRYLRYAIARLSAYRNVWWSLANEYDFMIPPLRKGQRGNKTVGDFDRFFSILQSEDPFDRQRSIHYAAKMYDNTKPWVTHASIQNRDLTQIIGWREKFQKPIVVDECRYEGNIPKSWGNLKAPEMVHQFWVGTICGGYVGHGETLLDPNDILWWSKGGALHGQSPPRIAFLRKTMEALPYWEMTPGKLDANVFVLAQAASIYLVYATKAGPIKLTLPGDHPYSVDSLDTWNMTSEPLKKVEPGEFTFTAPRDDFLLRIQADK
jgi:hypothetical protein